MAHGPWRDRKAPFALLHRARSPLGGHAHRRARPRSRLKVVPAGEHGEARLRGPNITPGYWRDEALTAPAFDEEGYLQLGDLVRLRRSRETRSQGFAFEGASQRELQTLDRHLGPRRHAPANLLAAFGDLALDVVIAAPDRDELTALVFPNLARCRAIAGLRRADRRADRARRTPRCAAAFAERLARANAGQAGSATRIVRIVAPDEPPSSIAERSRTKDRSISRPSSVTGRRSSRNCTALPEHEHRVRGVHEDIRDYDTPHDRSRRRSPPSTSTSISNAEPTSAADTAALKYFGDSGAARDQAGLAEYYRSRKMACVRLQRR